jgi:molecular chaperone DnaK (HSP70)
MAAKKQGIKVNEAVPKSLGVVISGGKLGVLIPKNTKIPCWAEKDYVNDSSGKEIIALQVFQGDNPDGTDGPIFIKDCDKIGHMFMRGFGKYE